jgi:hypothetical protein
VDDVVGAVVGQADTTLGGTVRHRVQVYVDPPGANVGPFAVLISGPVGVPCVEELVDSVPGRGSIVPRIIVDCDRHKRSSVPTSTHDKFSIMIVVLNASSLPVRDFNGAGCILHRGINLINNFCRLFERLLEQRIQRWMRTTDPQGPMQFGFREGVGTQDAFFLLSTVARSVVRLKELPYFACFIDLKKAFPSVLRSKAISILREYGAPTNTIRAVEALFSDNSCRLRVNGYVSDSFPINRGVKEGGINSPSIFSVVYAEVLSKLNITVLPEQMEDIDVNSVYYFAFADDLAFTCGNLSRLESVLSALNATLPEYGMCMNEQKTVWMPFLPTTKYHVEVPDPFCLRLGSTRLSCVDNFVYLGYSMNPFFGQNVHLRVKRNLLFSAARSCGKLLRRLEITNLKALRTYFLSMVSSQQYGLTFFAFSSSDYKRAAKVFLQERFLLPNSFPIDVAFFLLDLPDLEQVIFNARLNFLGRVDHDSLTFKALQFDRSHLRHARSGFSHDLIQFMSPFFDLEEDEFPSFDDLEELQSLRDQLNYQLEDRRAVLFRGTEHLSFLHDLTVNDHFPRQFGEFLCDLPQEIVRIILVCLGDVFRFSLGVSSPRCPFCPINLHFRHLFECPNAPFRSQLLRWGDMVQIFNDSRWGDFVSSLFLTLSLWMSLTSFFNRRSCDRVRSFLDGEVHID